MSRREIREQIFKILFQTEFYGDQEWEDHLYLFVEGLGELDEKDSDYIISKVKDIYQHLDEIDELINTNADRWKTGRMAKAELAIIRLAGYEMKYEEEIPVSVAINEAVELAKVYGTDHGAGFVNGILAKLA